MKIKVFAYASPESLYLHGINAGLTTEAADYFRHAEEFEIELDVDDTGLVHDGRLVTYNEDPR